MPVIESDEREELLARRARVRARLQDPASASAQDLRALAAADTALRDHDDRRRAAELDGLVRLHGALVGLRQAPTPTALIDGAPGALVGASGFTRAMLSRVRDGRWDPEVFATAEGVDAEADAFRRYIADVQLPLEHMRLETEIARRRIPALVTDPSHDARVFPEIAGRSRTSSYVVAPVVSDQRVIGFLHADRFGTDTPCDATDRDLLGTFAEHFGLLFERVVFIARLEDQRARMRAALDEAVAAVDALCDRELTLVRGDGLPLAAGPETPSAPLMVDALLSGREREILDGLAAGLTNAQLAHRLVLSEATIKSHLKRINRKLHTSSRSGAVARYLRLLAAGRTP